MDEQLADRLAQRIVIIRIHWADRQSLVGFLRASFFFLFTELDIGLEGILRKFEDDTKLRQRGLAKRSCQIRGMGNHQPQEL